MTRQTATTPATTIAVASAFACSAMVATASAEAAGKKVKVVATISTYGSIAKEVGGDRVEVVSLVPGNQDPHFVQPKLSLSEKLAAADLFIDTGRDLELGVPAPEDSAGNKKIMSGADGYVSASKSIAMLEVPATADRKEGDVHVFGNPHVYLSPVNLRQIARNVCTGLGKVDPAGKEVYEANLASFVGKLDEKLFGSKLVGILGGDKLAKLTAQGKLVKFLEENSYEGKPLVDSLGGWMQRAMPLRGKKVIAYHKNWAYFSKVFGIEIADYVEPKPGIPPSTKHVKKIVSLCKEQGISALLAATYYDQGKIQAIAKKAGVTPVVVAASVGGKSGVDNVFDVFDGIIDGLLGALAGK